MAGFFMLLGSWERRSLSRTVNSVFTTVRGALTYGAKFGVSDSVAVELLQTVGLRPGWIICLDDVERLSEKVGFENFLGYVTELRDKWQLKAVLIYNREPIDKDAKSPFHLYEEKVIDRSIAFALDLTDVVHLVFKDVRIAEAEYLRAALASLLLFCYMKFSNQKPAGLTFEMLTKLAAYTTGGVRLFPCRSEFLRGERRRPKRFLNSSSASAVGRDQFRTRTHRSRNLCRCLR
jgi:hypothetical protein